MQMSQIFNEFARPVHMGIFWVKKNQIQAVFFNYIK